MKELCYIIWNVNEGCDVEDWINDLGVCDVLVNVVPLCHFDDVVPGFDDVPTEFACFFFEMIEVSATLE